MKPSTLPLAYPEELDTVMVRVIAIGYKSDTRQYFYDEKTASIS
ncbi:MAG: hypothetical protein ACETWE_01700 [Candidatus Bathyarchaeia archaeon]